VPLLAWWVRSGLLSLVAKDDYILALLIAYRRYCCEFMRGLAHVYQNSGEHIKRLDALG
jgi:hypothetical protein